MSSQGESWEKHIGGLPERHRLGYLNLGRSLMEATTVLEFNGSAVPSLLRNSAYQEAYVEGVYLGSQTPIDIPAATRINSVLNRAILERVPPPFLHFVISDEACENVVGNRGIQAGQLRYMLNIANRERIKLQILEGGQGAHPGMAGNFRVIELNPTDKYTIFGSGDASKLSIDNGVVADRQSAMEVLSELALSPSRSWDYLHTLLEKIEGPQD